MKQIKKLFMQKKLVSICVDCWNKRNPEHKLDITSGMTHNLTHCYFCGKVHRSGVYIPIKKEGGD